MKPDLDAPDSKPFGFTLFEVLVALAILGVVLSLLYLTFHQSMMVLAETDDRAEVIRQGRMVLERISSDLEGAVLLPQTEVFAAYRTGLVGRSTKEGNDFLDRLDFTSVTPQAAAAEGGWGFREIGYSLDRSPGRKGLTLFRRQERLGDRDLLRGGRSLAVCDGVRSLGFSYFDRQGKRGKEWNSLEGERRNQLPSRVEVHLRMEDSRGRVHDFRTQVHLPLSG